MDARTDAHTHGKPENMGKNFNVLKPFSKSFSHFFQIKIGMGRLLERGCLLD